MKNNKNIIETKKSEIKITVGITAYKVSQYLEKALNSVINQSSDKWRGVLILDGGNDKHTEKLFNMFQHPNFKKYSFTKNQGPYKTRTKAIELSKTEWYLQLDGDDYLPENAIEILIRAIENEPNSYFIYGNCLHFNDLSSYTKIPSENIEDLCFGPLFNAASPIKIELFKKLGGYSKDLFINADWDFWLSVFEKNISGIKIDETIYARRDRNDSVGNEFMNLKTKIIESIISRHPIYFKKESRKNIARYHIYKKLAGYYKAKGNRFEASACASSALNLGTSTSSLKDIIYEGEMPYFRYKIRRIMRYISIKLKKIF